MHLSSTCLYPSLKQNLLSWCSCSKNWRFWDVTLDCLQDFKEKVLSCHLTFEFFRKPRLTFILRRYLAKRIYILDVCVSPTPASVSVLAVAGGEGGKLAVERGTVLSAALAQHCCSQAAPSADSMGISGRS